MNKHSESLYATRGWIPFSLFCIVAISLVVMSLPVSSNAIFFQCGDGDPCLGGGTGFTTPDCSPIIIDVSGQGFSLTEAAGTAPIVLPDRARFTDALPR
jgi:hypothetical protein